MTRNLLFLLFLPFSLLAQIPQYYNEVNFRENKELIKQQIAYLITRTHNEIGYKKVWDVLDRADEDPENPKNVLLLYGYETGNESSKFSRTRSKESKHRGGSSKGKWNREHVYAKSLGTPKLIGEGDKVDAGSDAHNLRASDGSFNSTRRDKIFEDAQGIARSLSNNTWYPGDEWKGDVARIIMYMYMRWGTRTKANNISASGNTIYKVPDMPDLFLKWNIEDPVSDFERNRNEQIFYTQTNRNPFIDNPYLATLIWGGDKAEDTWGLEQILSTNDILAKEETLAIYPSVAFPSETISISQKVNHIGIFSMEGKLVHQATNTQQFPAPLQKGVYIVKMLSAENNKPITKKMIVK